MRYLIMIAALLATTGCKVPTVPETVKVWQAYCAGWQGLVYRHGNTVYTAEDQKRIELPYASCVYVLVDDRWIPGSAL